MKTIHFETIDSTNEYLKNNFSSLDNLTFVWADYQSHGKGRNDREWYSNKKENLLFSFLIKEGIKLDNPALYGIYASIVIAKYLSSLNIKGVSIKWPNDVYVNEKKICGVLSIGRYIDESLQYVIVGIGLNVNQETIDRAIIHPFTSICLESAKKWEINYIANTVFPLLEEMVININTNKKEYDQYLKEHNYLKDKEVFAKINNETKLIKVVDIVDGKLLAKMDDTLCLIDSGEITFHI